MTNSSDHNDLSMTNTIEVPISLIQKGDFDAIREMLPKPNLFGRWAIHPNIGHGIIISAYPGRDNFVWFAHEKENSKGKVWSSVYLDNLTLEPIEPTPAKDNTSTSKKTTTHQYKTTQKPKTFADMTPTERAECSGMRCNHTTPGGSTNLVIYVGDNGVESGFHRLIREGQIDLLTNLHYLTPRFDLPRAWMPNGTPALED